MRDYEIVLVVHPDLDETALKGLVEKVQGWVTEAGGSISKTDYWGKRRMAYRIRKQKEGQYVLIQTLMSPTFGVELERNLRIQEAIMRFMVIAVND